LPIGTSISVVAETDNGWYKSSSGYYVKASLTLDNPPTPTPTPEPSNSGGGGSSNDDSDFASYIKSFIGCKYVYGGASPDKGFDCSGLVMYCYAQVGVSVPHGATQIWKRSGVSVPRSQIKVGDVICYDYGSYCGHVAIYVGNGQVIHASSTRGKVCYGNLDMMKIKAIKRIIQ
jgi:cell wall-associated NlpC family hydrolase